MPGSPLAHEAHAWLKRQLEANVKTGNLMMQKNDVHDQAGFESIVNALTADIGKYAMFIKTNHPDFTASDAIRQALSDMCATALLLGAHLRSEKLL